MRNNRLTIADLRSIKGKRQLTMLRVETLDDAAAAEAAGIDMISVPPVLLQNPQFRDAAPSVFTISSLSYGLHATADDYLRAAFPLIRASADAIYCAASMEVVAALRREAIPVCGHAGLIPSQATWTGGFRAVGKTAQSAQHVWRQVKALEGAGAVMAEIEIVPEDLAAEISKRTSLFIISMGAGAGCDAQYLFAADVLGSHKGHYPRHAKTYRNFAAEYDRLRNERVAAFSEFADDVKSGGFPEARHKVKMEPKELDAFLASIEDR